MRAPVTPWGKAGRWSLAVGGAAALGYLATAAAAWTRFGHRRAADASANDPLLDRFISAYDIVERHHIGVAAPAETTLAAASGFSLFDQPVARAVFRAREVALGAQRASVPGRGLLEQTQAMGWRILAEIPGRQVVMGAVTKPWEPHVTFRPIPPEAFAAFSEPGYVKIAWTLRADPVSEAASVFRTETRAVATDAAARQAFRRYWAFVSPGIVLIRWVALGPVKRAAERRARQGV